MSETIPTITVSLARKINCGNYESADVFMSINGISHETTEEDMNALLDGPGAIAYKVLRERMKEKVAELKGRPSQSPVKDDEYWGDKIGGVGPS